MHLDFLELEGIKEEEIQIQCIEQMFHLILDQFINR